MKGMPTLGKGTQDTWRFQNFLAWARLDKTGRFTGKGYPQNLKYGDCNPQKAHLQVIPNLLSEIGRASCRERV
jgi:hypothetical protein